jgi:thiol-disulfide isomerase/thioredoxin
MKNLFNLQKVGRVIWFLRPWAAVVAIALLLHYTGLLSHATDFTGRTMLQTGAMDFEPGTDTRGGDFDYNFSLKDLNGKPVDFSQFKGKVVFLNLWATWCGPCRAEMPSIQNLYNAVKQNDKIVFVMLSLDREDQQGKVVSYVSDKAFTFPVYTINGGVNAQIQEVTSIPTTFVISADGKIASKNVGTANYDTDKFKQFLLDLTKGR